MATRGVLKASLLLSLLVASRAAASEDPTWSIEALVGDAYNFDSPTRVEHAQDAAVSFNGRYDTNGFEGPFHYALRVARWQENRAWELQLLHHKIYLQDRRPPIEALSVSHGFNIVTLNRVFDVDGWRFRLGAGPVIAHPEAQIAGVVYDGPYELAGAAALAGIGKQLALTPKFYLLAEIMATYGDISVHPDGSPALRFTVRNPAVHAQLGVGYRF